MNKLQWVKTTLKENGYILCDTRLVGIQKMDVQLCYENGAKITIYASTGKIHTQGQHIPRTRQLLHLPPYVKSSGTATVINHIFVVQNMYVNPALPASHQLGCHGV
jgi:hypothetical protein